MSESTNRRQHRVLFLPVSVILGAVLLVAITMLLSESAGTDSRALAASDPTGVITGTKTASPASNVLPGDRITYTIVMRNNSTTSYDIDIIEDPIIPQAAWVRNWEGFGTNSTNFQQTMGTANITGTVQYGTSGSAGTASFSNGVVVTGTLQNQGIVTITVSIRVDDHYTGNLLTNTVRFYAWDPAGGPVFSFTRQAVVQLIPLPAAPINLNAFAASQTRIDLLWTDTSTDETGFKIERSPDGATGWTQIDTVGAGVTSYANTGLSCGTSYSYRVRAYNARGDSAYTNVANATTVACSVCEIPAAPTNLSAAATSPTQVVLTWTDNSANESGFRIYRVKAGRGSAQSIGSASWPMVGTVGANVTTFTDTNLTGNTMYLYYVSAYNGCGEAHSVPADPVTTPSYKAYVPMVLRH